MRERSFWVMVAAILVVALVFRLPGLATRSLWIDELFTEWFAARSFAELWTDVPQFETHPPFYYSVLKLWTLLFGNSELGLRSLWLGLALTLVVMPAEQRLRNFLIFLGAGILALLVWAPYLPIFLEQSRKFMGLAFWLTPKLRDLYSAWLLVLGDTWLLATLPLALLLYGLFRFFRRAPVLAMVVTAILLVPLYTVLALSLTVKPIYIQRLFAWMVPTGLALIGLGIVSASPWKWLRLLLGLVVIGLAVIRTVDDYDRPIDDWKAIVAEISQNAQPGDVVITVPAEGSIAVGYYARRYPNFPTILCVPGCYPQRDLPRTYMSNFGAPAIIPADAEIVERALATHRRVWLVQVSIALYDPKSIIRSKIAASRKFVRYTGNSLAKVELFE